LFLQKAIDEMRLFLCGYIASVQKLTLP